MTKEQVAEDVLRQTIELRRALHQHPELSDQESETTKRIKEFLEGCGLSPKIFSDMNGLIVDIDSGADHWVIFRADIDALPIIEATDLPHASITPGIMHACGHDFHAAIAAGLAVALDSRKSELGINVRVVFQPAEENNPTGGAKRVIQSGVCDLDGLTSIYGLHLWPEYKVGQVAFKAGAQMAASDKFTLIVEGKSAHAAEPHNGIDAILIGSKIVEAIIEGVRRRIDPKEMMNISIGTFHSEGRYNVISDHVRIEGTIRTFSETTRSAVHGHLKNFVEKISSAYGAKCTVEIQHGYPVLVNDESLVENFSYYVKNLGDSCQRVSLAAPSFIGEDFAYYGTCAPAMFLFLGSGSDFPLHSNKFNPDESVLQSGIELMLNYLLSIGK